MYWPSYQSVARGAGAEAAAVVIQDHPHVLLSRVVDHRVHHLQAHQTLQVWILREVDAVGRCGAVQGLLAKGSLMVLKPAPAIWSIMSL